ncbi:MAG TPA: hypothetical protein VGL20_08355 [Candidatus Dormibacteraeota bacterium]
MVGQGAAVAGHADQDVEGELGLEGAGVGDLVAHRRHLPLGGEQGGRWPWDPGRGGRRAWACGGPVALQPGHAVGDLDVDPADAVRHPVEGGDPGGARDDDEQGAEDDGDHQAGEVPRQGTGGHHHHQEPPHRQDRHEQQLGHRMPFVDGTPSPAPPG